MESRGFEQRAMDNPAERGNDLRQPTSGPFVSIRMRGLKSCTQRRCAPTADRAAHKQVSHVSSNVRCSASCVDASGLDSSGASIEQQLAAPQTVWDAERSRTETHKLATRSVSIRDCTIAEAYPAADCHISCFYARTKWMPLLRLDRVLALKVGADEAKRAGNGSYVCFVAEAQTPLQRNSNIQRVTHGHTEPSAETALAVAPLRFASAAAAHPGLQAPDIQRIALAALRVAATPIAAVQRKLLELLLTSLKWDAALPQWGVPHEQRGIVGTVVFDTFGYHLPAERMRNGRFRRRTNVGYLSNMAVSPSARRQGIARLLVARCEALAERDPTVDAIALHVDGSNLAAKKLYESMGYTNIHKDLPSAWTCLLGITGEGPGGLLLMVKPLRDVMLTGAGSVALRRQWWPVEAEEDSSALPQLAGSEQLASAPALR